MPRGFSLMEILLAVIILGIVAALTIPLVAGYKTSGDETALRSDLALLRSGVEMFAADHNGAFPGSVTDGTNPAGGEAALVAHLSKYSNADGEVADAKSAAYPFGPYLPTGIPKVTIGPLEGTNGVKVVAGSGALAADANPAKAWMISTVTGQVICNCGQVSSDGTTAYEAF
jgi:prepilin-type N-terminal cleavage/methylation domain-containing protein